MGLAGLAWLYFSFFPYLVPTAFMAENIQRTFRVYQRGAKQAKVGLDDSIILNRIFSMLSRKRMLPMHSPQNPIFMGRSMQSMQLARIRLVR